MATIKLVTKRKDFHMNSTSNARPYFVIHTDGACSGNPGPGGWGAVINKIEGEATVDRTELSAGEAATTNNQMELTAVISALTHVAERPDVETATPIIVKSDSQYVVEGYNKWRHGWRKRGWRTADKSPVKNLELWKALEFVASTLAVTFEWVRGHNGDHENEAADALAVAAIPAVS
ncbi:ribonuclease HI [Neorhizobium galegae]|nr:ribonuclease HI [Neorhizobium galegae]